MPSGSRSKTLQRKLSGDCASIPSGSSRKCFRLLVTMTWAPAFTAAATTCLSFSSFFIAAISGSWPVTIASGNASPMTARSRVARSSVILPELTKLRRLFEDLVGPVELEQAFRGRPQQRVAERERVENVRVQNDLEGRRNHPS